jgi:hypothetical protein
MGKTRHLLSKIFGGIASKNDPLKGKELYLATATTYDKLVPKLEKDEEVAKKRLDEAFQNLLNTARETDNISIQAATNYLKAGDYANALTTLERQLSRKEVQEDITRYRLFTNRVIKLLGSDEGKAYGTAAAIAQQMAVYESELADREVKAAQKQVKDYGRCYRKKAKEMMAKAKNSRTAEEARANTLEAFVQDHFSQK